MRILHIGSGNLYGGIETLLITLARFRHLCPEMEPHFAFSFEGRISSELCSTGVPVYQFGNVRSSRPWTVHRARQKLRSILNEQKFDVVICHGQWVLAVMGPAVKKSAKLVFWMHDWTNGRNWLAQWVRTLSPEFVICNSRYTSSALPSLFKKTPAEILSYPVNFAGKSRSLECRAEVRREVGASDNEVVIVQVSRMEAWKGHVLHLKALSLLMDVPNWQCWIIGGPQSPREHKYEAELKSLAVDLGIADRVHFLGQSSDVQRLLAGADIFCQPNRDPEPFGIVFIEALLAGLPVASTAIGGALEIIDKSCGILSPAGDAAALSKSLQSLIESPQLRSALGQCGPNRARQLCDPRTQLQRLHRTIAGALLPNCQISDQVGTSTAT